jgi:hypothetical protein
MKKQDEYKIGAAAKDFIEKYKPELPHIKKAELEAMLKEFAIQQVKNTADLGGVSGSNFICAKENKGEPKCKEQCGWCQGDN